MSDSDSLHTKSDDSGTTGETLADGTPIQVRGATILTRFHYLTGHDEESLNLVIDLLPEAFRIQAKQGIVAEAWYPVEFFSELNRVIDAELGQGDGSLYIALGRHAAEQMLGTIHGSFYERGNPMYLFERAQAVWNQYYSTGKVEIEELSGSGIRLKIVEFAAPQRSICQNVRGWMERAVEFAGGVDLEVRDVACAAHGDEMCILDATWDLRASDEDPADSASP